MTRPLRLEAPGAIYHVTSRGDRRGAIYYDNDDRLVWLDVLGRVCLRFNFVVHAYCQMTNHYHMILETVDGGLARGMRQLNGAYSQQFNRRHKLVGHVFQGRYKAILVQRETYLLELARYVVLNPVRAGMVARAEDWQWSSQRHFMQGGVKPDWLDTDWLLSQFGPERASATCAYSSFVAAGAQMRSPLSDVQHQVMLGDKDFIAKHLVDAEPPDFRGITRTQRRAMVLPLAEYAAAFKDRNEAMAMAYGSMGFSMEEIARYFPVSPRTVGRAVQRCRIDCKIP